MANQMTKFHPFRDVAVLQDEMDRLFRQAIGERGRVSSAGAWSPAIDVEEDQDGFTLHVELPGVDADEVEVSLEDDVLTIGGERRFYDEREADGFKRIERHFGRFHRAIRLPDRVKGDEVDASYRDGMLTITVPKAEEAKPRRIEVRTS